MVSMLVEFWTLPTSEGLGLLLACVRIESGLFGLLEEINHFICRSCLLNETHFTSYNPAKATFSINCFLATDTSSLSCPIAGIWRMKSRLALSAQLIGRKTMFTVI